MFAFVCFMLYLLFSCLYVLHAMVFMRVFFQVCVLCEEGFARLHLLSVCCWRYHVMSIMGKPSCLEPELLASVSSFIALYFIWCSLHLLVHHCVFPTCCSLCSLECLLFWDLACLIHGGLLCAFFDCIYTACLNSGHWGFVNLCSLWHNSVSSISFA